MCGKDWTRTSVKRFRPGSPPRVRERRIGEFICRLNIRITPACAGKTNLQIEKLKKMWDHPRVCGKD